MALALTIWSWAKNVLQYYDFSNVNLNNFLSVLNTEFSKHTTCHEVFDFTESFDLIFKLEKPQITKRIPYLNSIISAIEKKKWPERYLDQVYN